MQILAFVRAYAGGVPIMAPLRRIQIRSWRTSEAPPAKKHAAATFSKNGYTQKSPDGNPGFT